MSRRSPQILRTNHRYLYEDRHFINKTSTLAVGGMQCLLNLLWDKWSGSQKGGLVLVTGFMGHKLPEAEGLEKNKPITSYHIKSVSQEFLWTSACV